MSHSQEIDIRAVALDMDGTLLSPVHKLSSFTRSIIEKLQQRGITCIVSTGRSIAVTQAGGELPAGMYAVCLNGAQIAKLGQDTAIKESYIPEEMSRAVIEQFTRSKYHLHAYYGEDLVYHNFNRELLAKYGPQFLHLDFKQVDYSQLDCSKIYKFVTVGKEKDGLNAVLADLQQHYGSQLYANYSMPGVMEIMHSQTSKGKGLEYLLEHLGLNCSQLMAIGDGFNDIPMWQVAKVPVVMGNAFPELKQRGYYQAPSNADDGAAQFLRTWFHLN